MLRHALVIVAALAVSCKKQPPKGDLPPATDWSGGASTGKAPANPHGDMASPGGEPANPHGDMASPGGEPANPHGDVGGPGGSVPEKTPPTTLEKLPDGSLALGPFAVTPPADWKMKPTTSNMRVAAFDLPAKAGGEAELVVTYFGPRGAGTVQENIDRWVDQFTQADGKSSHDAAKIETTKFAGQDATFLSISGRYTAMAMPGAAPASEKSDQAALAAIVSSPSGPYYFKLVGAKPTIDASATAFRKMLDSLKLR